MSVLELKALARKHWTKYLPNKVRELKAEGLLEDELHGVANLAQDEIEALQKKGYQEHEAREVVLPQLILLPPEEEEDDAGHASSPRWRPSIRRIRRHGIE